MLKDTAGSEIRECTAKVCIVFSYSTHGWVLKYSKVTREVNLLKFCFAKNCCANVFVKWVLLSVRYRPKMVLYVLVQGKYTNEATNPTRGARWGLLISVLAEWVIVDTKYN